MKDATLAHLTHTEQAAQAQHDSPLLRFAGMLRTWRTAGLLKAIPAEDLKNLLLVLSFTTTSGHCRLTTQQLAHALHLPEVKARRRLDRLARWQWQGQPLLTATDSDTHTLVLNALNHPVINMHPMVNAHPMINQAETDHSTTDHTAVGRAIPSGDSNTPLPDSAHVLHRPESVEPSESAESPAAPGSTVTDPAQQVSQPVRRLSRREQVIEASRRKYGRPRAEVERMVAEQLGYISSSRDQSHSQSRALTKDQQATKRRLMDAGVDEDGADWLLGQFDLRRIQKQLDWLPQRTVRNPAGFLMAAVQHDYEPPFAQRRPSAVQIALPAQQASDAPGDAPSGASSVAPGDARHSGNETSGKAEQ